ncbi:glycerophosphoinositol permease [Leucoagaricus gongylophorus]
MVLSRPVSFLVTTLRVQFAHFYRTVNTILTRLYGSRLDEHNYGTTIRSVVFAGTVVGMIIFGYLSDKIGRKFGMMSATGIVALFSALSAASKGSHESLSGMLAMLSAMRFLLGIGIGAEYPCGSVSASEQTEQPGISKRAQHRWFALATNTMIDFGFVVAAFVPLVLFWIFGDNHLRAVWRISLGLGVIPALVVFLWRLNMDEPERFKKDSMRDTKIPYLLVFKRYWVSLLAISFTWFLYDFIVYPFGIYSSTIVDRQVLQVFQTCMFIHNAFSVTGGSQSLAVVFGWSVVIKYVFPELVVLDFVEQFTACSISRAGTLGGAFILDYLGPKYTMITGLLLQAIVGFIMSGLYKQLTAPGHIGAFAVVYGIFSSLGELGPGNCLGLLASKTSPTAVRGQFYGIAAAIGKIGAFIGTWAFPPMIDAFGGPNSLKGNTGPFWVGSGLAILSAIVVLFFVKPLTTDGMTREDEEFRRYLRDHGFDTSTMGFMDSATSSMNEKDVSFEKV